MKNKIIKLFQILINFLAFKKSVFSYIDWPIFSVSSFVIANRLKQLGIEFQTIIDVGANQGQFSVAISKLFPSAKIICIEADDKVIKKLKKNINNLNFQIINSAVGNYCGYAKFNVNNDSQVSSLLELGSERIKYYPKSHVLNKKEIRINKLDNLLKKIQINRTSLLKIDVQGYELNVLKGAKSSLKKIDWCLIEIALANLYEDEPSIEEIILFMNKLSFKFHSILNYHLSPDGKKIIEIDALFRRNNI